MWTSNKNGIFIRDREVFQLLQTETDPSLLICCCFTWLAHHTVQLQSPQNIFDLALFALLQGQQRSCSAALTVLASLIAPASLVILAASSLADTCSKRYDAILFLNGRQ